MRRSAAAIVVAAAALAPTACQSDRPQARVASPAAAGVSSTPSATLSTAPPRHHRVRHHVRPTPTATPAPAQPAGRPFAYRTRAVGAAELGKSWHQGCPVPPSALAAVTMTYWGFDAASHTGTLVVNRSAVTAIVSAFRSMYAARFPIRAMRPISAYGGDDNASMADDNTSAFNCRAAVSNGPKSWSMHAYGDAVDIDPRENPYRLNGKVLPPEGRPYMDRSNVRRGMIVAGSAPVHAFTAVGWGWGGYWSSTPDYQHFSSNGR